MADAVWLVPALPLAGAAVNLFAGRRLGRVAGWLASGLVAASFVLGLGVLRDLLAVPAEERLVVVRVLEWFRAGDLRVVADLRVDPLSATMILVVAGVGTLIHVYAIGYMAGDPRFGRFFAYLNLFVFFMLTLVLADDLVLLYLGWEGVGLCSYLLIGFWHERPAAARAAVKAFVTTRIGDTAMLAGLALIFLRFGTFDLGRVLGGQGAGAPASGAASTAIALLLFAGAVGKSAQFPLHVWLPDAMEGPTPVSALIHAATMVAAGVYLVARMYPVFDMGAPVPLLGIAFRPLGLVALIGTITALMASYIAFTQNDIKRILAFSTCSQLGYMFIALGCGGTVVSEDGTRHLLHVGFSAALFHLTTHAFFKALLFLGSGSVIHGTGTQDIWEMGGLRKYLPATTLTFLIGTLALIGFPGLAGFWSKDQILEAAKEYNGLIFLAALFGAGMTAFYMTRLYRVAFCGQWSGGPQHDGGHGSDHGHDHGHGHEHVPHESPRSMLLPLYALTALAIVAGFLGLPPAIARAIGLPEGNVFAQWVHYSPPQAWLETNASGEHARRLALPGLMAQAPHGAVPDHGGSAANAPSPAAEPAHDHAAATATHPAEHGSVPASNAPSAPIAPDHGHDHAAATAAHAAEHDSEPHEPTLWQVLELMFLGTLAMAIGATLAYRAYEGRRFNWYDGTYALTPLESALYYSSRNKLYFDEIYSATLVRGLFLASKIARWLDQWLIDLIVRGTGFLTVQIAALYRLFDSYVVDGLVNFSGWICGRAGDGLRRLQTGQVPTYVMVVFLGVLAVIAALVQGR